MSKDTLHEQIREAFRQEREHGLPPEPEPNSAPRPAVTVNYPHRVSRGYGRDRILESCSDGNSLFMSCYLGEWEGPLCAQLDPSKRYRLELRFFEVEE